MHDKEAYVAVSVWDEALEVGADLVMCESQVGVGGLVGFDLDGFTHWGVSQLQKQTHTVQSYFIDMVGDRAMSFREARLQ